MPMKPIFHISSFRSRNFSTTFDKFKRMNSRYKKRAIETAQIALTEYLHTTRSLPFTYAEHITKNSICSLKKLVSKVGFESLSSFSNSIQRFLRYHPVNEFQFFYESIGINYSDLNGLSHPQKFFISEDSWVFNVSCALSEFGFPWNSLGKLYKEEISIFSKHPDELSKILDEIEKYGFSRVTVIGICLVFPFVLGKDPSLASEINGLLFDLRKLFIDFNLANCIENDVQAWLEVCRKVRIFYHLGCKKGKMGELMGKRKHIFLEYQVDVLVYHFEFFSRLGVDKNDVSLLLLERPEIFDIDLKDPAVSVSDILNKFGLDQMEMESIVKQYPYVLGRNKMGNLPEVMRALNLHVWFFDQMRNGNHFCLRKYVVSSCGEDIDNDYKKFLDRNQSSRTPFHTLRKLEFLHGIGFGENSLTITVLNRLHGSSQDLQERFDFLHHAGIQFSKLCRMIRIVPTILNNKRETLEKKMKFLLENTGFSLELLDDFPAVLCFDLEKRIKPRYRFHVWLIENGLSTKRYCLASMIATSEKSFIARVYGIHPAAVKHWFECFSK